MIVRGAQCAALFAYFICGGSKCLEEVFGNQNWYEGYIQLTISAELFLFQGSHHGTCPSSKIYLIHIVIIASAFQIES